MRGKTDFFGGIPTAKASGLSSVVRETWEYKDGGCGNEFRASRRDSQSYGSPLPGFYGRGEVQGRCLLPCLRGESGFIYHR